MKATPAEGNILHVLWDRGRLAGREVHEAPGDDSTRADVVPPRWPASRCGAASSKTLSRVSSAAPLRPCYSAALLARRLFALVPLLWLRPQPGVRLAAAVLLPFRSPLHRQAITSTHSSTTRAQGDISTLP